MESKMTLEFRQLQYGRCDLLVVTNKVGDGVMIPRTKFLGRKLVPMLINKNNISEFAQHWTGLRKALFADSKIGAFKLWLQEVLTGTYNDKADQLKNTPSCEGVIVFDELSTISIKKGVAFVPDIFSEYFFTDPKHTSSAQYRGEKHTAEKVFPTARGSAWLFQALKTNDYGVEVSSFSFS